MKKRSYASAGLALLAAVVAGCASTKVVNRQPIDVGKIPRPHTIVVYYFAATPEDAAAADPALVGEAAPPSKPPTAQQAQDARQLGVLIATELAAEIQDMGLTAKAGPIGTPLQMNDIVIKGYLLSADPGSRAERMTIGFGAGASELTTAVEGFQMTPQGLRKLGSGTLEAGGGKTPGAAVGVATLVATGNPAGLIVSSGMKIYGEASGNSTLEGRAKATAKEIADKIKPRFQEQGWIQ